MENFNSNPNLTDHGNLVYALQYTNKYNKDNERQASSAPVITFSVNLSNKGFLTPTIIRNDGRTWKQHRNVYMECGPIKDVLATAFIQMGGTKVLALVTGLIPLSKVHRYAVDINFINFTVKYCQYFFLSNPDSAKCKQKERTMAENLSRAIEPAILQDMMGNCQVNVEVILINNDGNATEACILASSLALYYGKIPMRDLVTSATLAVLPTGVILVDPTQNEKGLALPKEKEIKKRQLKSASSSKEKELKRVIKQMCKEKEQDDTSSQPYGIINLAYMPKLNEISAPCIYGNIPDKTLHALVPIIKEECIKIYEKMRNIIDEIQQNKYQRKCHKIPEIYEDMKSFYGDL